MASWRHIIFMIGDFIRICFEPKIATVTRDFNVACSEGDLVSAQITLLIFPDINVLNDDYFAFNIACKNGHLEVAKWLLTVKPTMDITMNNDRAFCFACVMDRVSVAKWLCSLCPKYAIILNETDDHIVSWKIKRPLIITPDISVSLQNNEVENRICLICQDAHAEIQSSCHHNYCKNCIQEWVDRCNSSCPYCRSDLTAFTEIESVIPPSNTL